MRVGSLVFTTDQGLSYLAKDFYDHGIVTDVMVIRHGKRTEHNEWYPGAPRIGSTSDPALADFCSSMDAMLFFETPFNWGLFSASKYSILMPMHECMPDPLPARPDFILAPSLLDLDWAVERNLPAKIVTVPVPDQIKWKERTEAKVFVHNAGNGGLRGRNGTEELLRALEYTKNVGRIIIRSQVDDFKHWRVRSSMEIDYRVGTFPFESLWADGDVFVFPEKFNGLSLPLQEAYASGMLVMCGDRYPMNIWLPKLPLIPVSGSFKARVAGRCCEFDQAIFDPRKIAETIDLVYGTDIRHYSSQGLDWGVSNSWNVLGPIYKYIIEGLVHGSQKEVQGP